MAGLCEDEVCVSSTIARMMKAANGFKIYTRGVETLGGRKRSENALEAKWPLSYF